MSLYEDVKALNTSKFTPWQLKQWEEWLEKTRLLIELRKSEWLFCYREQQLKDLHSEEEKKARRLLMLLWIYLLFFDEQCKDCQTFYTLSHWPRNEKGLFEPEVLDLHRLAIGKEKYGEEEAIKAMLDPTIPPAMLPRIKKEAALQTNWFFDPARKGETTQYIGGGVFISVSQIKTEAYDNTQAVDWARANTDTAYLESVMRQLSQEQAEAIPASKKVRTE
jgi:hypothetical protein